MISKFKTDPSSRPATGLVYTHTPHNDAVGGNPESLQSEEPDTHHGDCCAFLFKKKKIM